MPFEVRLRMTENTCKKSGLKLSGSDIREFTQEYKVAPAVIANAASSDIPHRWYLQRASPDRRSTRKLLGGKADRTWSNQLPNFMLKY